MPTRLMRYLGLEPECVRSEVNMSSASSVAGFARRRKAEGTGSPVSIVPGNQDHHVHEHSEKA